MKTQSIGYEKPHGSFAGMTAVTVGEETYLRSKRAKLPKGAPMTYNQRRSQAQYSTLNSAYRVLEPLLKYTLLRERPTQRVNALFIKYNSLPVEFLLPKDRKEGQAFVFGHYIISRGDGSLPSIALEERDGWLVSDLCLGGLELTEGTTLQQFASALMGHNKAIDRGDTLTLVRCRQPHPTPEIVLGPPMEQGTLVVDYYTDARRNAPLANFLDTSLLATLPGERGNLLAIKAEEFRLAALVHGRLNKERRLNCSEQRLVGSNPYIAQNGTPEALDEAIRSYGPVKRGTAPQPKSSSSSKRFFTLEDFMNAQPI